MSLQPPRWSVSWLCVAACLLGSSCDGGAAEPVTADWVFKKVGPVAVPVPKGKAASPIDAFLLVKLEAKKFGYSPAADRGTLLRRVTFDLTGLPPTPEELKAFLDDASPNAYEKVVARLLSAPQYGERSALFWLDLVRFAETDGFKSDDARPNAWRYRDYIVGSFNADKPYDRFVKEQIAGDELWPDDPQALVATGFLRHYPDEYNAVNLEQRRQEILNDITDTVGAAFLGVTLGCARCHDHKFDPISHKDYYRMASVSSQVTSPSNSPSKREAIEGFRRRNLRYGSRPDRVRPDTHAGPGEAIPGKGREEGALPFPGGVPAPDLRRAVGQAPAARTPPRSDDRQAGLFRPSLHADPVEARYERKEWDALAKELAAFDADKPTPLASIHAMTDVGREPPRFHPAEIKPGDWRKPDAVVEPGFFASRLPAATED